MLAPQSSKNRALVVFGRFWGGTTLSIQHYPDTVSEFFPVDAERVRAVLGPDGEVHPITDAAAAEEWVRRLRVLFGPMASEPAE